MRVKGGMDCRANFVATKERPNSNAMAVSAAKGSMPASLGADRFKVESVTSSQGFRDEGYIAKKKDGRQSGSNASSYHSRLTSLRGDCVVTRALPFDRLRANG